VTKRKGCGDVTVEQPLAGSSGSSVVARAKALKAGGWSPIGSARQKLSPQGVQGVSVGQPWATIAKENPGFPSVSGGTSRTFGGRTVTFVVWRGCEWGFDRGVLTVINPLANRTIDELGVGSSRSSVDALLGESVSGPASGAGHVVYVADREKGLAWDVTYDAAGRVVVIVLCHCMPPSNDLPAGMSRQW